MHTLSVQNIMGYSHYNRKSFVTSLQKDAHKLGVHMTSALRAGVAGHQSPLCKKAMNSDLKTSTKLCTKMRKGMKEGGGKDGRKELQKSDRRHVERKKVCGKEKKPSNERQQRQSRLLTSGYGACCCHAGQEEGAAVC